MSENDLKKLVKEKHEAYKMQSKTAEQYKKDTRELV
jgi:hypothetical protein